MVKDFLREHKIEFEDVNVGEDQEAAKEMVKKSSQMGVPVIDIDGKIVVRFDKEKLKEALNIEE
jgi:glutaredoxin